MVTRFSRQASRTAALLVGLFALACSPAPPAADPLAELDARCLAGEAVCERAADGYALRSLGDQHGRWRYAELLYQACRQDRPAACSRLADHYASGDLAPPPAPAFAAVFERACGTPLPSDRNTCMAAALHGLACQRGHGAGCAGLHAIVSGDGLAFAANLSQLVRLELDACHGGHPPSCARAAARFTHADGVPLDYGRARVLAKAGCEAGRQDACRLVAEQHARGLGGVVDLGAARRGYGLACEAGDAVSCVASAQLLRAGLGGPAHRARAIDQLQRACDLESAEACEALGRLTEAAAADPAAAFELYQRAVAGHQTACEVDDEPAACLALGRLVREGSGTAQSRQRGLALQRAACVRGHGAACMAWMVRPGGMVAPPLDALPAARDACQRGDGSACLFVGAQGDQAALVAGCEHGDGAACNGAALTAFPPTRAGAGWLNRGCDLGHAPSCHHLALASSFDEDRDGTARLLRDACRLEHGPACTRLGFARLSGELRLDFLAGAQLLSRGCELGDPAACRELGTLLIDGRGTVPPDPEHGIQLLSRACRMGDVGACIDRGERRMRARDPEALPSLRVACDEGHPRACLALAKGAPEANVAVVPAAEVARRQCRAAMTRCSAGGDFEARWLLVAGRYERTVDTSICGIELERGCNVARELAAAACERDAGSCLDGAVFIRELAAQGLGFAAFAEPLEARALKAAEAACRRGDRDACARRDELGGR